MDETHPVPSSGDSPSEALRLRELLVEASQWEGWTLVPDGSFAAESLKTLGSEVSEAEALERLRTIIEVVDQTAEQAARAAEAHRDDHLEFLLQLRERLFQELHSVSESG